MQIAPPHRVQRTYTQRLDAPPADIFPLLCPVREIEWVDGWAPIAVFSHSGLAEPGCVFLAPDGDREAVWMITQHNPQAFFVEFVKVTPGRTAGRIRIQLRAAGDAATEADVTYQYTALGDAGEAFVDGFTEDHYAAFMRAWEAALNHFLRTGTLKRSAPGAG